MERLAARIAEAREALGLTQAQLAERVPCNPQRYRIGRPAAAAGFARSVTVCLVLGRPVSWFLGEAQTPGSLDAVQQGFAAVGHELAAIGELLRQAESPAATDRLVPIVGWLEARDGEIRA